MSRTLYRDSALADGRPDRLQVGISVLVEDGVSRWIRPADDAGEIAASEELVRADGRRAR